MCTQFTGLRLSIFFCVTHALGLSARISEVPGRGEGLGVGFRLIKARNIILCLRRDGLATLCAATKAACNTRRLLSFLQDDREDREGTVCDVFPSTRGETALSVFSLFSDKSACAPRVCEDRSPMESFSPTLGVSIAGKIRE